MTRRPAIRRPPRLDDHQQLRPAPVAERRAPTIRRLLVDARITGRQRIGRSEVLTSARRICRGEPGALFELEPFSGLGLDEVITAIARVWGPDLGSADLPAALSIDPDATSAQASAGLERVADVARRGGRIAFVTTRPASLLPFHQELARLALAAGADVLTDTETGRARIDGRSGRHLRWFDRVAVVTDGRALLGGAGFGAGDELLFQLAVPDLVVADRAPAGTAITTGIETVVLAGLDAIAFGVAAARGAPTTVIPVDDTRAPAAYEVLLRIAHDVFVRH